MAAAASGGLELLGSRADHSWVRQLTEDPERPEREPNKTSRQVRSGHYVLVKPTPLAEPLHIIHSKEMAAELGLDDEACASEEFVKMFSAGQQADGFESWATPYALSIYGQEMYQNCPFKNGNGYGDGRAITLGEVVIPSAAGAGGTRWELQLKGAGTTPFCRGGDGRAVLRSSIREFLVSEAMHHLGVSTTRALSLMGSRSETVSRPWYSNSREVPGVDDPRLAHLPMETRKQLLAQLGSQLQQPDVMISEQCAITCRVATSFTRVGHIELHGRRCKKSDTPENREALEKIVKHAIEREFWDDDPDGEIGTRILRMLGASQQRIAALTADWIRVGFCQGNFNSDNCLVAGRTMDYGPFGFMEQFAPLWNMWSGGGDHFGFLNQPTAGMTNFKSLLTAVVPLLSEAEQRAAVALGENSDRVATKALEERCWRPKLGFRDWDKSATPHGAQSLLDKLLPLLTHTRCDWTMFWRQLAELAELADAIDVDAADEAEIFKPLLPCFHECTGPEQGPLREAWEVWLRAWAGKVKAQEGGGAAAAAEMRRASPKYVPREWMLVDAYTKAKSGDYSEVEALHELFKHPYDEQESIEAKYYKKVRHLSRTKPGAAAARLHAVTCQAAPGLVRLTGMRGPCCSGCWLS